jgi:hypothetical protein
MRVLAEQMFGRIIKHYGIMTACKLDTNMLSQLGRFPVIWRVLVFALLAETLLIATYGKANQELTFPITVHSLRTSTAGDDSTGYMSKAQLAYHSPDHRIYSRLFFEEHEKFIYPPSSLFMTEALEHLPAVTWKILLDLGWLMTLLIGLLMWYTQRGTLRWHEGLAICLLGVLFRPIADALYSGQVQLWLSVFFAASVLLWSRERKGCAGLLLALTCAFKPQLALFLLWGCIRREWRFAGAFALMLFLILICALTHFGLQNHLDYLRVLSYLSRHGESVWGNQTMNGLLNRLYGNGNANQWEPHEYAPYKASIYLLSTASSVLLLVWALWVPSRGRWANTTADLLFFGCASVLMSPIAWAHHYIGFYFLFVFLLAKREERLARKGWLGLSACVVTMVDHFPRLDHIGPGLPSLLNDYLFFGGIVSLVLFANMESSGWIATQGSRNRTSKRRVLSISEHERSSS